MIVTEGTLPPTTHSTYNNRRHPTAALTPTLTTATPVASHTTVPEMVPLLPTGPADHYLVSEQKLFTHSENKVWDIFHLYPDLVQNISRISGMSFFYLDSAIY